MADGSIWDEIFDTRHVSVLRTYIERWPRKGKPPEKVLIVVVEPDDEARNRCPKCGTRGIPVETGVRRWRTLDVHGKKCFLESALPRIECPQHGKITAAVPWARHDDHFSMPFESHASWLAAQMPWTKASAELRITWEALANIVTRVTADAAALLDRLDGLAMIGIDEKSWGKGSDKFLTVVTTPSTTPTSNARPPSPKPRPTAPPGNKPPATSATSPKPPTPNYAAATPASTTRRSAPPSRLRPPKTNPRPARSATSPRPPT